MLLTTENISLILYCFGLTQWPTLFIFIRLHYALFPSEYYAYLMIVFYVFFCNPFGIYSIKTMFGWNVALSLTKWRHQWMANMYVCVGRHSRPLFRSFRQALFLCWFSKYKERLIYNHTKNIICVRKSVHKLRIHIIPGTFSFQNHCITLRAHYFVIITNIHRFSNAISFSIVIWAHIGPYRRFSLGTVTDRRTGKSLSRTITFELST